MLAFMRFGRLVSWIFLMVMVPGVSGAQEEDSALSDYVRFYRRFLDRGPGEGGCAMYPSCSRYGLMVFRDCYFPRAMMLMADRMIRCGHDFEAYRLTLQGGRLFMLDLPPYAKGTEGYVYDGREYYAYADGGTRADSTLLFVNSLINRKMYREALLEGIADEESANRLRGCVVYAAREDLPLPPGGCFVADLLGLPVRHADTGELLGTLTRVDQRGHADLYTVLTPHGEELLPAVPQFVVRADPDDAVYVRPIPGLLDGGGEPV